MLFFVQTILYYVNKCIFKNIVGNLSVKTNIMFYVFTESKDLFFLPFYFKSLWLELDFLSFHKTVQIGLLLEPYFKVYFQFLLQSIYLSVPGKILIERLVHFSIQCVFSDFLVHSCKMRLTPKWVSQAEVSHEAWKWGIC